MVYIPGLPTKVQSMCGETHRFVLRFICVVCFVFFRHTGQKENSKSQFIFALFSHHTGKIKFKHPNISHSWNYLSVSLFFVGRKKQTLSSHFFLNTSHWCQVLNYRATSTGCLKCLRDFGPCWHDGITQWLQICRLYIHDVNLRFHHVPTLLY